MSSVLTSHSKVKVQANHFPEVETYAFTNTKILLLSENFQYVLYNSLTCKVDAEGQLPETQGKNDLRVNTVFSYWWCQYTDNTILYYSIQDECLKLFDLMKPDGIPKKWSCGAIKVQKKNIHNFIWQYYDQPTKTAYLLHENDENTGKIRLDKILQNSSAEKIATCNCNNVNMILKGPGCKLFFADNDKGKNFPIYMAHSTGICKINFEVQSDVNIVDFGFQKDEQMVVLYNAVHKTEVGCFLIDFNGKDLEYELTIREKDKSVANVVLQEDNPKDSIIAGDYFLVNQIMQTITIITFDNKLITFRMHENPGGIPIATKEDPVDCDNMKFEQIVTNFALDRESMLAFEVDHHEKNVIHIASHRLTNLNCIYSWFLLSAGKWNPGEVCQIIDLLV